MKIKYFKIKNYAGIKYGINNNELELSDIPSGIIMLNGQNGSGKSTTLHTLHIFSDDKSFLIKNEDGTFEPAEKILIVEHNNVEYKIVHQYSKNGSKKSFISKNDQELNSAGNVSTFENIVITEFKIENNTVSNSVIGVSEINFIDLISSERKKQISTLLPNISEYEKSYKSSNESLNGSKKQMQLLSQMIANSGGLEIIENKINDINKKIEPIKDEICNLNNDLISLKEKKAANEAIYIKINNEINDMCKDMTEKEKIATEYSYKIKKIGNIENIQDINYLYKEKEIFNTNINELKIKRANIVNEINNMNNEWSIYYDNTNKQKNIELNRNNLTRQKEELEKEINYLKKELNNKKSIVIKNYYSNEISEWVSYVGKSIRNELDSLNNIYTISINDMQIEDIYNNIEDVKSKILKYENLEKELASYGNYLELFKNINEKTTNHSNSNIEMTDGCSFSKCSIQYKVLIDIYTEKYNKLFSLLDSNRNIYEQYKSIKNLHDNYNTYYKNRIELANVLNLDSNLFINAKNFNQALQILRNIKKEISDYLFNISNLPQEEQYINSKIEYYQSINKQISECVDIEIKPLSFDKSDINNFENEIKNIDTEINNLREKIANISKHIEDMILYKEIDNMKNYINNFEKFKKELLEKKTELQKNKEGIEENIKFIDITEKAIISKEEVIGEYKNELEKLTSNMAIIKDKIDTKEKLDTEIEYRGMVVSSLHPTKGIPSLLVKNYLDRIEKISNNILEITFDSSYKIFLENLEKDFYVRVFEKSTNRYISDVKLCSSGQQAIIKLVLSIALNKCAVGNAIYLRLDECDSVLSKENLAMVEVLLNSLLDKFGIEQVFIVTHNSSVSVCDLTINFDREEQTYTLNRLK